MSLNFHNAFGILHFRLVFILSFVDQVYLAL